MVRLHPYAIGQNGQNAGPRNGYGNLSAPVCQQGASVNGIDISPELLKQAERLDRQAGVKVNYLLAKAEEIPFDKNALDIVTAGQCWHWFNAKKAASECLRVLKPGGALVICHFDWLPLPSNMVELTESLILKHNPSWTMGGGTGLYPDWLKNLGAEGFENLETFSFDCLIQYSHEDWRGRIRASAGVLASLPTKKVALFDLEHQQALKKNLPQDPMSIPHRVWALIARKPWS